MTGTTHLCGCIQLLPQSVELSFLKLQLRVSLRRVADAHVCQLHGHPVHACSSAKGKAPTAARLLPQERALPWEVAQRLLAVVPLVPSIKAAHAARISSSHEKEQSKGT